MARGMPLGRGAFGRLAARDHHRNATKGALGSVARIFPGRLQLFATAASKSNDLGVNLRDCDRDATSGALDAFAGEAVFRLAGGATDTP